jgi:putative peptide zinc metalloprotease protein
VDAGGRLARVMRPRRRPWAGAGPFFERLYDSGGWRLFTRTGLAAIATTAVTGAVAFGFLVAVRYGTPFVVARHVAIGGIVFFVGRLVVAGLHETAHALTLASFGRRVGDAGLKLIMIFPYLYVDTSDAWFEPRLRRIAVSAAGPVSDLSFGGAFSLCCLLAPVGAVRDVFFQLAFGAYIGALFNLNPLLERDGYQILVDVFGEPGLRALALKRLRLRLAGGGRGTRSPLLDRYGLLVVAWTIVTVCFALVMSLRYKQALGAALPGPAVWALLVPIWAALLMAPLAILVPPLMARRRAVHS